MSGGIGLGCFTMPVHPRGRDRAQILREDRETVVLADSPGFHGAFSGEHLGDDCHTITSSMMELMADEVMPRVKAALERRAGE